MSDSPAEEFTLADWEAIGLKLLVFTRYWARTHYRWLPGRPLPQGKTPEDVSCDVYAAFATGQRELNESVPLMVQLKGAARSMLWNLHNSKEAERSTLLAPGEWELIAAEEDPADAVATNDFYAEFWRLLHSDGQVQRSTDLKHVVEAVASGADTVEEICSATKLSVAQVYELRRRLKSVAEKIFERLNDERGELYERGHQKISGAAASSIG